MYYIKLIRGIPEYGIKDNTIVELAYASPVDALKDYWKDFLCVVSPEHFTLTKDFEAWPIDELELLEDPNDK